MKFIARFLYVPLAGLLVLTSCAKDETESYDKFENQALEAWMTQHRSDLVENLQSEGLYYVDLLDAGDLASDPINTEDIWVSFDFSGRDLSGNIILTRNADDAVLAGSFSKYTHYVPFYRYCGSENSGLMEGTWLASRSWPTPNRIRRRRSRFSPAVAWQAETAKGWLPGCVTIR